MKYGPPLWMAAIAALCLALAPVARAKSSPAPSSGQLSQIIERIRTADTAMARTEAAEQLADATHDADTKQVDDRTIADVVSLLDSNEDSVRYWVAASLGNFGTRARFAAPRLERLLAEIDCSRGGKTSAGGIRYALKKMGVTPPPASRNVCDVR